MILKPVEQALNNQIVLEAESSNIYLAMASWAEIKGFSGISDFLYTHAEEERQHMLKLVKYINERGGKAIIPALKKPDVDYKSIAKVFETLYKHETFVSEKINKVIDVCLKHKDHTTNNFMQWYVAEQIEEEALVRTLQDKLEMIGDDKGGLYLFDRDITNISVESN